MPIILEQITFGYILGAAYLGVNFLLAETYCCNKDLGGQHFALNSYIFNRACLQ
tara:strand:- start:72 stop:233 length:162 start_codon:yes stop_codon:yes gene_type:complete